MKKILVLSLLSILLLTSCSSQKPTSYTCTVWPEGGICDVLGENASVPVFAAEEYDVVIRTVNEVRYIGITCEGSEEAAEAYRDTLREAGFCLCQVENRITYMADIGSLDGATVTNGSPIVECAFRYGDGIMEISYNIGQYNMIYHTDRFIDNDNFGNTCATVRYIGEGFLSAAADLSAATREQAEGMDRLRNVLREASDSYDRTESILRNYEANGYSKSDNLYTKEDTVFAVSEHYVTKTQDGVLVASWKQQGEACLYTTPTQKLEITFLRDKGIYRLQLTDGDGVVRAELSVSGHSFCLETFSEPADTVAEGFVDGQAFFVEPAEGHTVPLMYY